MVWECKNMKTIWKWTKKIHRDQFTGHVPIQSHIVHPVFWWQNNAVLKILHHRLSVEERSQILFFFFKMQKKSRGVAISLYLSLWKLNWTIHKINKIWICASCGTCSINNAIWSLLALNHAGDRFCLLKWLFYGWRIFLRSITF